MSVSWMIAFALFSSISNHCSASELRSKLDSLQVPATEVPANRRDVLVNGKSLQKHLENSIPSIPHDKPFGLPPRLTPGLKLDSVSQIWQKESHRVLSGCLVGGTLRCPISWVSGIPWREERWIANYFQPLLQGNKEWSLIDDSNGRGKIGWIPHNGTLNAELNFVLNEEDHHASNIQTITLFYMKSYGPRWENSVATIHVQQRIGRSWIDANDPMELGGVHNKSTSEMYTHTIHVTQTSTTKSTALRIRLIHTGGATFKLMGIAACQ